MKLSLLIKSTAAVALLLSMLVFAAAQNAEQQPRRYPWQYFWQQSLAAYGKKDFQAFLENSLKAVEAGPKNHPTLYYNLARAYSLTGDKTEAVKWLEKTLELGFGVEALDGGDFQFLLNAPEYSALRRRIETVKTPIVKSRVAATVSEPDLIPEGIAYDEKTGNLYLGSLHKRKIVKIDRRGRASDFVAEAADGLGSVVGIKVDAARRSLLVLSNIAPNMKNFDKAEEGTGMLHRYDLASGKLLKKYVLANQPRPHLLNDLVITAKGDLFITDSFASVVHVIRQEKDELEVFAELAPYSYPNGIALSKDESRLYVANLNGISIIDVKSGKVSPLEHPEAIALAGIDGLYFYENDLLAIQNFESPNRVARFRLSERGDRALSVEVFESNHPLYQTPTTGVISRQDFYYIANSQLRSFDENGRIFPVEKLKNIVILKMRLPAK